MKTPAVKFQSEFFVASSPIFADKTIDLFDTIRYNNCTGCCTIIIKKGCIGMLAVNYSTIRNKLKEYCDKATDEHETVIVTRKNEKNVVLMSLEQYNDMMKALKNAEYLAKIDRAFQQLEAGQGQKHELIEVDDDE
jgi:antitoxin YefM